MLSTHGSRSSTTERDNSVPVIAAATCPPNVCQECRQSNESTAATGGPLDGGKTEKSKTQERSCSNSGKYITNKINY